MSKSTKTKSSTGPSKLAAPYITGASDAAKSAFATAQPIAAGLTSDLQANLPSVAANAFDNPTMGAANSYVQDTLGGKFLSPDTNPYLGKNLSMLDQTVTDATNGGLGTRGLAGGSTAANLLSKNLANANNTFLSNAYNTERGYQNGAATQAAQLSTAGNSNLGAYLSYTGQLAGLPQSATGTYADEIARLLGGSTTTTGTQTQGAGNTLMNVAGLGLSALAIPGTGGGSALLGLASDRRLKTDIQKLGEHSDGLGVYQFRYKWDDPADDPRAGVMHDEVERLRPWAVGAPMGAFGTVHYEAL